MTCACVESWQLYLSSWTGCLFWEGLVRTGSLNAALILVSLETISIPNTNRHCRVRFYAFVGQPLSKQLYLSCLRISNVTVI